MRRIAFYKYGVAREWHGELSRALVFARESLEAANGEGIGVTEFGIIGAMEEEVALLLGHMTVDAQEKRGGTTYYRGTFMDRSIVVCQCGVGKVNAAVCTESLISVDKVEAIIFTGVAGALHPELDIGDVVISSECLQHDVDASALGFPPGTIPYHPRSVFKADERFVAAARQAGEEVIEHATYTGSVLSGDQFIADTEDVQRLREAFGGWCTEMEGAAVAQVCDLHELPFVVIRSISDKADHSADVNFAAFTKLAAEQSYRIVRRMLQLL